LSLSEYLNLCDLLVSSGLLSLVIANNTNGTTNANGRGRGKTSKAKAKVKDRQALFLKVDSHAVVSLNVVEADIRYAIKENEYLSKLI
jgi:hypothetical protein